jgi:exopolysaccharide biosynthesis polyprenyl glycosylphosphotransferase
MAVSTKPELLTRPASVEELRQREEEAIRPLPSRVREASRSHMLRRLLLVADIAAFLVAIGAAELYGLLAGNTDTLVSKDVVLVAAAIPTWLLLVHANGLYHVGRRAEYGIADELGPILHVGTLWTWMGLVFVEVTNVADVPLAQAAFFWVAAMLSLVVFRAAVRARGRRQIWYLQNTLVVGDSSQISTIVAKIVRHPEYGVNLVGCVAFADDESVRFIGNVPVLDREADILAVIGELDVERVIVAWNAHHAEERLDLIHDLSDLNVQVDLVPSWFELLGLKLDLQEMEGTPLLTVPYTQLSASSRLLKRVLDLALTSLTLVVMAPVFLLAALAIKLDSPGPVFFRQQRIGRDGKPFTMLKFRSMYEDAEARKAELAGLNFHGGGLHDGLFKVKDDPRVTRIGRLMRRLSIDELPQLVNVLRGDMSLVGPRPLIESEARQVAGRFRRRGSLTPGVTGLWQVVGRSEIPFDQMVSLDYLYATSWSIWGDLKILVRTFSAVFARHGAY